MIALGGPKLKRCTTAYQAGRYLVSMIALGGPKLKLEYDGREWKSVRAVSMIALGGPKLKLKPFSFIWKSAVWFQ